MKNCCTILFFLIVSLFTAVAQNELKKINEIKSDTGYLYATGTSTISCDEASNAAKDLLGLEIEQWLKDCDISDAAGYAAKSKENLSLINTQRGKLFRAFVYIQKYCCPVKLKRA